MNVDNPFFISKVQDKIKEQADILDRFEKTLEREELSLRETIASLLQEVQSPSLLELDATPGIIQYKTRRILKLANILAKMNLFR